jgi:ABC-type phosphate transport system substrate-binding protein
MAGMKAAVPCSQWQSPVYFRVTGGPIEPKNCRAFGPGLKNYAITGIEFTGASFVLMYKEPANKQASKDVIKFFSWAFKDGQQLALDLDYVPLPDTLTKAIASKVWSQIKN